MKFMETIEKGVSKTLDSLYAKNKKLTYSNRIRLVLRSEYETLNNAYIELGKYYYENLREQADSDNKRLCEVIDGCIERIEKAKDDYYRNMAEQDKILSSADEKDDCDGSKCEDVLSAADSDDFDKEFSVDAETENDASAAVSESEESEEAAESLEEPEEVEEISDNTDITEEAEEPCEAAEEPEETEETDENTDDAEEGEEVTLNDDVSDAEDSSAPDITDIAHADDLPIADSFDNLTDTASIVDIKNENDEQDKIDLEGSASDEIIADAYLQAHNAADSEATEDCSESDSEPEESENAASEETDSSDVEDDRKTKNFKSFINWDRLKDEISDDLDYICNNKDSDNSDETK